VRAKSIAPIETTTILRYLQEQDLSLPKMNKGMSHKLVEVNKIPVPYTHIIPRNVLERCLHYYNIRSPNYGNIKKLQLSKKEKSKIRIGAE
jgi:hypothetical protein